MFDIALSPSGDLVPNWAGGLKLAYDLDLDFQDANFRAQTNNPDFNLWPIGANLEDLGGMPNIASTGQTGSSSLYRALVYDKRFSNINVDSVPISYTQIQFDVAFNNNLAVLTTTPYFSLVFNLNG